MGLLMGRGASHESNLISQIRSHESNLIVSENFLGQTLVCDHESHGAADELNRSGVCEHLAEVDLR